MRSADIARTRLVRAILGGHDIRAAPFVRKDGIVRKFLDHARGHVVAAVCVFLALSGTSIGAVATVAPDSVGTPQLKNGAVTATKVARHSLTGLDINLAKLGTVPNSRRLGGLLPSGFQRPVTGSCSGRSAIAKIGPGGAVLCTPTGTGTLTGISGASGSGITGGGMSGAVRLGIDRSVIQQRIASGCPSGQAITSVSQDGSPSCQAFGSGDGTITSVTPGTDLTGGGSSGDVTISADETKLQHRLTSGCPSGQAITSVDQDGTPSCQAFGSGNGTITGVSAGTGLSGGGSSGTVGLSLASSYQLPQSCTANQLAEWSGTAWGCVNDSGSTSWQLTGNSGTDPSKDYLGTSDNQPLNLDVDAQQAFDLQPNATSPNLIGGSSANTVTAGKYGATIGGGGSTSYPNTVTDNYGTVGGGAGNAAGAGATVAGGSYNNASGANSTASGMHNTASSYYSTAIGVDNSASGYSSTALGDTDSASGGDSSAFGDGNRASAESSTAAGYYNTASAPYATALGQQSTASGNASTAAGEDSVAGGSSSVALGSGDEAFGNASVALGQSATVPSGDDHSFVWSDGTVGSSQYDFDATGSNQFDALASNGFSLQLSAPGATFTGCTLTSASGWACSSDRNVKRAFRPINDQSILTELAAMPIESWSYKLDPKGTRHIGPTAQAFMEAFHIGNSPRLIGTLDEGGVALASVKGLYQLVQRQQATINRQQHEINWLMAHIH